MWWLYGATLLLWVIAALCFGLGVITEDKYERVVRTRYTKYGRKAALLAKLRFRYRACYVCMIVTMLAELALLWFAAFR